MRSRQACAVVVFIVFIIVVAVAGNACRQLLRGHCWFLVLLFVITAVIVVNAGDGACLGLLSARWRCGIRWSVDATDEGAGRSRVRRRRSNQRHRR